MQGKDGIRYSHIIVSVLITPMIAFSSCIVTCLALSTAAATCCWC